MSKDEIVLKKYNELKQSKEIKKLCNNCKHEHNFIPEDHQLTLNNGCFTGIWFNCSCLSTLFVQIKEDK